MSSFLVEWHGTSNTDLLTKQQHLEEISFFSHVALAK